MLVHNLPRMLQPQLDVEPNAMYRVRWPLSNNVRASQLDDYSCFSSKQVKLQLPEKDL